MSLTEIYNYVIYESSDSRTSKWFLMGSPFPLFIIIFTYLYFVLRYGPCYMGKRQAYQLKTFIRYYNIFQIIANTLVVYCCLKAGFITDISLGCEPVNYIPEGQPLQLASVFWWVLLLKLIDFIETGVFLLRKKTRQISFLHLYHHVSTVIITWISTKYFAGGMATFPILINSIIHIIMYTYYLGSSGGPTIQQIINPLKPYITVIQMVQFFVILFHTAQALLPYCHVQKWGAIIMIVNLIINFLLFYNFYQQNYVKSKSR